MSEFSETGAGDNGWRADKEPAEAHVVRWYMHRIDDARDGGSDKDISQLIPEMHEKCDHRIIRRIELERQIARQSLGMQQ